MQQVNKHSLDYFLTTEEFNEQNVDDLNDFIKKSDSLSLYYGDNINVIVFVPIEKNADFAVNPSVKVTDSFQITGTISEVHESRKQQQLKRQNLSVFRVTKENVPASFVHEVNDEWIAFWTFHVTIDKYYEFRHGELEIRVNKLSKGEFATIQTDELSDNHLRRKSSIRETVDSYLNEVTSDTKDGHDTDNSVSDDNEFDDDEDDSFINEENEDFNLFGAFSNDKLFPGKSPTIAGSIVLGSLSSLTLGTSHTRMVKKRFSCYAPLSFTYKTFMLDEFSCLISIGIRPVETSSVLRLLSFEPMSSDCKVSMFRINKSENELSLFPGDMFSFTYRIISSQPLSSFQLMLKSHLEVVHPSIAGTTLKHNISFGYTHTITLKKEKDNTLLRHKKSTSSLSAINSVPVVQKVSCRLGFPQLIQVGETFGISVRFYNATEHPIELHVQLPPFFYREFLIPLVEQHSSTDSRDAQHSSKPSPGIIALSTTISTGFITPMAEKSLSLQFYPVKPGFYDLGSIKFNCPSNSPHLWKQLHSDLKILVESS
ncbi:hypothetical protein SJAG_03663 [Schizosaccharomyces japonicus yFS275]|uniref:Uncharacterized protein n=1 Tax=Schizosaccharomyces japonicus (strain yFS275 / FY16936) TaxID=402676 RepID=B6K4U9_SCHJY|nr:hypothetical protein SJAG_03663 [Schizosaccharomyces japonicus yFS275]EEB08506.1 hypothetical protein SJAG_03663 [Schizosaccharomyces japonicus yFS275]